MTGVAGDIDDVDDEIGGPDGDSAAEQAPGVTVLPATFRLVAFDAAEIAEIAASWRRRVGLPDGLALRIEVNELSPLSRSRLIGVDPAVLTVESGALESAHRPRQLSQRGTAEALGRLLLRLRDRLDLAFADAPEDKQLTLAQATAWEVYAMGRLGRLGIPVQRPRWLYHFRLRHGFTDVADAAFDRLWEADELSWASLSEISAACREHR